MVSHTNSETQDLVRELESQVTGEVRFDKISRLIYSTDASIYQIEPIGVVIPKTDEDVIAVIETAHKHNIPVLPRGGGTSLAGQAVGKAIVIDFSKYMRKIIEVNPEENWVRTQPGIVLDELNHQLKPSGLLFAPDPSTSNRSNVGGALGNNSCGAHSIIWGKTVDNVSEINAILSNGSQIQLGPIKKNQIDSKISRDDLEGQIYKEIINIGNTHRNEIIAKFPKIMRRVSGYNLDELVSPEILDMARFAVGSEGTLLTITEAKLDLVARPKHRGLAVLHFRELIESMEATVVTLEMEPAAVEMIDSMIIRQARENLEYSRMMDFIEGRPEAILLVEMIGESESEVNSKLEQLELRVTQSKLGYAIKRITKPSEQAKVWAVRKAGLGLMMNTTSDAKPLPFVEDTAVAPEFLPEYVKRFNQILLEHETTAGYYGHASVGCLHIRPMINLKLQEDVDKMVSIADEVSNLVLEFEGSISGEHGDGLVRSPWLEKMFGSQLYDAFGQVKKAFDPKGIMNPGKIVDSTNMTENLRVKQNTPPVNLKTRFNYSREGNFYNAVEMCNGQGACRKTLTGTMCPSYMVTREEEHSTRGRANALRAAISGALPLETLTSKRLYEVMDLCLECKGCVAECPSNVDMSKLKYEFLDNYYKVNGYPLRNRLFGNISKLNQLGTFLAPISNFILQSQTSKNFLNKYLDIDRRRNFPKFANQTFIQWFQSREKSKPLKASKGQVVIFPDTFTNYNQPRIGQAATILLENMGYQVVIPKVKCCGRPTLSKGPIDKTILNARFNVDSIFPYIKNGAKLVGLEPSCILTFKDTYVDLLGDDKKTTLVSQNTMLIEEFILYSQENDGTILEFTEKLGNILFQGHCHQKALVGTKKAIKLLESIPGCNVQEIESGCCGMAGAFGFEKEHYDISMKIGEQTLFPAIRSQNGSFNVVSEGVSCRQQIEDGTGKKAKHLVEILLEATGFYK